MTTRLLITLCTVPDRKSAEKIAQQLLEQHLAACVSITVPVTSFYRWAGKLESNDELLLLIKTTRAQYPQLESLIHSLHPYELPEILAVPVEQGLNGYLNWVEQCTTTKS
ncbi:MAG: divalent-cation tolerance protein CutA [Gammaproteobacteria bacterium]|nr:divalent-cation tolerance protein CutA [Gammaproteobacteria bacterium]